MSRKRQKTMADDGDSMDLDDGGDERSDYGQPEDQTRYNKVIKKGGVTRPKPASTPRASHGHPRLDLSMPSMTVAKRSKIILTYVDYGPQKPDEDHADYITRLKRAQENMGIEVRQKVTGPVASDYDGKKSTQFYADQNAWRRDVNYALRDHTNYFKEADNDYRQRFFAEKAARQSRNAGKRRAAYDKLKKHYNSLGFITPPIPDSPEDSGDELYDWDSLGPLARRAAGPKSGGLFQRAGLGQIAAGSSASRTAGFSGTAPRCKTQSQGKSNDRKRKRQDASSEDEGDEEVEEQDEDGGEEEEDDVDPKPLEDLNLGDSEDSSDLTDPDSEGSSDSEAESVKRSTTRCVPCHSKKKGCSMPQTGTPCERCVAAGTQSECIGDPIRPRKKPVARKESKAATSRCTRCKRDRKKCNVKSTGRSCSRCKELGHACSLSPGGSGVEEEDEEEEDGDSDTIVAKVPKNLPKVRGPKKRPQKSRKIGECKKRQPGRKNRPHGSASGSCNNCTLHGRECDMSQPCRQCNLNNESDCSHGNGGNVPYRGGPPPPAPPLSFEEINEKNRQMLAAQASHRDSLFDPDDEDLVDDPTIGRNIFSPNALYIGERGRLHVQANPPDYVADVAALSTPQEDLILHDVPGDSPLASYIVPPDRNWLWYNKELSALNCGCNEETYILDGYRPYTRRRWLRCGRPGYYCLYFSHYEWCICDACRREQEARVAAAQGAVLDLIKMFHCEGCANRLTSRRRLQADDTTKTKYCICGEQMTKGWLCNDHRNQAIELVQRRALLMKEYLIRTRFGNVAEMRCPVWPNCTTGADSIPDPTSNVWTCCVCKETVFNTGTGMFYE